jgi:hypothetical protein
MASAQHQTAVPLLQLGLQVYFLMGLGQLVKLTLSQ